MHPNVLRLYEVMDDPRVHKLYLVLEYMRKGDIMNVLHGDARRLVCDPMDDAGVWHIFRQASAAVQGSISLCSYIYSNSSYI
jgi:serine/threonine protein kinase